jgi:tyrosine aminotransferase
LDILKIAEKHKLPIIADEVYELFTFPGVEYFSFTSLSKNVPVSKNLNFVKILIII